MAKIAIIGAGVMGSALSWPLADNGHDVRLIGTHLDDDIILGCRNGGHPKLRRPLPEGVQPYLFSEIDRALEGCGIIVSGVNSFGVSWVSDVLRDRVRPGHLIISVTKGLSVDAGGAVKTFPDLIGESLSSSVRDEVGIAAVGGPCIASELAGRRQTCVVFGSRNLRTAESLSGIFRTPYYHVWPSEDLTGLETAVALKNAYSLGVGYAFGLLEREGGADAAGAEMLNFASAVFAQAVGEIHRWIALLGGKREFAFLLPGAGDIYVTVAGGRSVKFGKLLGSGKSFDEALGIMKGETLEAVEIIRVMDGLIGRSVGGADAKDFPLMRMLGDIVVRRASPGIPLDSFFSGW